MIYFYVGLISIFLVFYTIYKKTNTGKKTTLGSYFIIKNYLSRNFNVLNFKQIDLLFIRLLVLSLLLLLIYNPSNFILNEAIVKDQKSQISEIQESNYNIEFNTTALVTDDYIADVFFINTFVKNYKTNKKQVEILYNPSKDISLRENYTYIIFPSKEQDLEFFKRFKDYFYISNLETGANKIEAVKINNYYPVFINDEDVCIKKLTNSMCLVISINDTTNNFLIFTSSLATFWGDLGVSAYFVDIIDMYLRGISFNNNLKKHEKQNAQSLNSLLPKYNYLRIFLVLLLLESLIFILRKKIMFLILFMLSFNLHANSFKFIFLDLENIDYSLFVNKTRTYIEDRTSVKFDNNSYDVIKVNDLNAAYLPDLPFLWIFACTKTFSFKDETLSFFKNFINKGGIIFSDSCGVANDFSYNYNIEQLAYRVIGLKNLDFIDYEKAILKSFFILDRVYLKGVPVSQTTMRIPLFISRNNLYNRIKLNDEEANKLVLNVVLYMLSGNYKSDQVHTRHILDRIKNRDLIR